MKIQWSACVLSLVISFSSMAEVARPKTKIGGLKPTIWQSITPQEQLKVRRVAQMDAYRALAERIYGFQVDGYTCVYDFMLESDVIRSRVNAVLRGAFETEPAEYFDDGSVQVVYGVNMAEIIEEIERFSSKNVSSYKRSVSRNLRQVEALGMSAIPDTEGMRKVHAKRAAELDAYRQMAERVTGIRLSGGTTVAELCLESDQMLGSVSAFLKGLKPVSITFDENGSCEVVMQLKKRQIIETVETAYKRVKTMWKTTVDWQQVRSSEVRDRVYKVTGRGAPRAEIDAFPASIDSLLSDDAVIANGKTVIRRVIEQGVVVE